MLRTSILATSLSGVHILVPSRQVLITLSSAESTAPPQAGSRAPDRVYVSTLTYPEAARSVPVTID